jgi:phospholipase A1
MDRFREALAAACLTSFLTTGLAVARPPDAPPPPAVPTPPAMPPPVAPTPDATRASRPPPAANAPTTPIVHDDLLTFYKDNYLLTGFTGGTEVKFQFSAKFDLWPNATQHAVYLAFSDKALWNLYKTSAPFRENNYNPELFYTYFHHPGRYEPPPGCAFFSERLGIEHESNGEAGATSRGWNRLDVESRFACYDEASDYGIINVKLWAPPIGIDGNPDIVKFLGYGELTLSAGMEGAHNPLGGADVSVVLRKGTGAWSYGSVEVDARWRPPYGGWWRFTPYLYGQFFGGDGETLLNYDHSITAIRVGIGLSDRSTRTK